MLRRGPRASPESVPAVGDWGQGREAGSEARARGSPDAVRTGRPLFARMVAAGGACSGNSLNEIAVRVRRAECRAGLDQRGSGPCASYQRTSSGVPLPSPNDLPPVALTGQPCCQTFPLLAHCTPPSPPPFSAHTAMSASESTASGLAATLSARKANSTYAAHLKIWESSAPESASNANSLSPAAAQRASSRKARYLILSVDADGAGITLHKAKRNANGSFSIGKDWDLRLLQGVQVFAPDSFALTISRTYKWQSERPRDQQAFLIALVRVYRTHMRTDQLPHVIGLDIPPESAHPSASSSSPTAAPVPAPAAVAASTQPSLAAALPAASAYAGLSPKQSSRRPSVSSANSGASDTALRNPSPAPPELPGQRNGTSPPTFSQPAAGPTPGLLQRARSRSGGKASPAHPTASTTIPSPAPAPSPTVTPPVAALSGPGYNQLFTPPAPPAPASNLNSSARHGHTSSSSAAPTTETKDDLQDAYDAYDDGAYITSSAHTSPAPTSAPVSAPTVPPAPAPVPASNTASTSSASIPPVSAPASAREPVSAPVSAEASPASSHTRPHLPPRDPLRVGRSRNETGSTGQGANGSHIDPSGVPSDLSSQSARAVPPAPSLPSGGISASHPTQQAQVPEIKVSSTFASEGGGNTLSISRAGSSSGSQNLSSRARLSSIEPARGGAAYERMLLAGTGMRDVGQALGDMMEEDEEDEKEIKPQGDGLGLDSLSLAPPANSASAPPNPPIDSASRGEEEEDTLLSVEEMLETYEWNQRAGLSALGSRERRISIGITPGGELGSGSAGTGLGAAEAIEASLKEELRAVDAANIHGMVESDDRVAYVEKHIVEALSELERLDQLIVTFKVSLNARLDDISFVESQNRGLQVQMANQRQLAEEITTLLDTVHVDAATTQALQFTSLDNAQGVGQSEAAAAALYKSILQAMAMANPSNVDTEDFNVGGTGAGPRAMQAKVQEYLSLGDRFSARVRDFLTHGLERHLWSLRTQQEQKRGELLAAALPLMRTSTAAMPPSSPDVMQDHAQLEASLEMYCGLLLFIKEASPKVFNQFSANYLAQVSDAYKIDFNAIFSAVKSKIRKATDEESAEISFTAPTSGLGSKALPAAGAGMLRSGTVRRMGTTMGIGRGERLRSTSRSGPADAESVPGGGAFNLLVSSALPIVQREQAFLADFLHINKNQITFADYMDLETFFRHQAKIAFGEQASAKDKGGLRNMHDALSLCFGFFAQEAQSLADYVVQVDRIQVVSILATLDKAVAEAKASKNDFLEKSFGKLHTRLATKLDQYVAQQIRAIEQTRLSAKKGTGVTHFVRTFPVCMR